MVDRPEQTNARSLDAELSTEDRVNDLLLQWEELRDAGQEIRVDELCDSCPELAEEVERRIRALGAMDDVFEDWSTIDTEPVDCNPKLPRRDDWPDLPNYEIESELGRGGMGVVYRARQLGLGRTVAIKMIVAGGHASAEQMERFHGEAAAIARLQHPNIVQVYDIGEQDGHPFFSLEYVRGGNLADSLSRTPRSAQEAAELIMTLARAVHEAHDQGIIHRDLKPANVLLTEDNVPKVTDFGLAKQLDNDSGQTRTGSVLGTPSYMAPEQAEGRLSAICPATDVYALGAILYECVTERPPFRGATSLETLKQVSTTEPVAPSRLQPKVPLDLETICLKCLEKDIRRRYATAADLAEDLQRFINGQPIVARPISAWGRTVKFARRRPAVAALSSITALALLALVITGVIYNGQLRATNQELTTTNVSLQQTMDKNQRLLALSFVAYGRACALAAKEANLDDPLVVSPGRGQQLAASYDRQLQLAYDLLVLSDPGIQPEFDAFQEALQANREGDTSQDLRQQALELSHACRESWERSTQGSPELQASIRQHVYGRACAVAHELAHARSLVAARHEYAEFWELYWGEMAIVENREVETATIAVGKLLQRWRALGTQVDAGDLRQPLQEATERLHAVCGVALPDAE